jgi:plastocyanin
MVRRAFLTLALSSVVLTIPAPATAGGGGCVEVTEGTGTTVELLYACLTPTLLRVQSGETVTFVNRDDFRHVISGSGYAWSSDGNMRPGEAFTATFRKDGVFPYQCFLHPGMAGAVIVGDATGLGAADRGGVVAAPIQEPLPEVVYVTRAPEPDAATSSSGRPVALVGGILLGGAIGAIVALGVRSGASRRRTREVAT